MPNANPVDILLATYNGAPYLPEQLDSLLAQTFTDWRLIIRDDRSTDGTLDIVNSYISGHPGKISLLDDLGGTVGPCGNFAMLMAASDADYIMFCDQDDVWLPDKMALTLAEMREMERRHGAGMPILVHTDLHVVDERLARLGDSFWRYSGIDPRRIGTLNRVLMQNFATGCTVMINRALADLAMPIPPEARMHDWWLALVATCFGKVSTMDRPTALYRQHGRNDSGASRWGLFRELARLADSGSRNNDTSARDRRMESQELQAEQFLKRYKSRLSDAQRECIKAFCRLRCNGYFMRRYITLRYGFLYSNHMANLGLLLFR